MARLLHLTLATLLLALLLPATQGTPTPTPPPPPPPHHIPIAQRSAQELIAKLNLIPNIEKGYYIQTFQDTATVPTSVGNRSASTAIYYLLEGAAGPSVWHRVDAVEVWHFYAGAPLTLTLSADDGRRPEVVTLGPDLFQGQRPQVPIPGWRWQSARSLGEWTLVGTTVAPGFLFSQSELAAPGWKPSGVL
ncbi:RmlC-like cupin domain-containing protein [Podospora appendiculata]|uniref:RmlC-like cupin domain-containing protein n=1 Tax=Podospora appendiculata TaxID=314037 RepID=A0AAE1C9T1_9PEZI|nr:RmlC-like cupin domain-containing protein [Podospora appendiculata]